VYSTLLFCMPSSRVVKILSKLKCLVCFSHWKLLHMPDSRPTTMNRIVSYHIKGYRVTWYIKSLFVDWTEYIVEWIEPWVKINSVRLIRLTSKLTSWFKYSLTKLTILESNRAEFTFKSNIRCHKFYSSPSWCQCASAPIVICLLFALRRMTIFM
jgi:hypothetical protein